MIVKLFIPEIFTGSCALAYRLLFRCATSRRPDPILSELRAFCPLAGGGWLVEESVFRFLVDFEIQKAQRLRYSVSLVCLVVEPTSTGSGEAARPSLTENIRRYIRGTDAVVSSTQGWLGLLLIDADTAHLPLILDRLAGRLGLAVWSAGGSCYPRTAAMAEQMFRQAVDLLGRAREEGGNRLYVGS